MYSFIPFTLGTTNVRLIATLLPSICLEVERKGRGSPELSTCTEILGHLFQECFMSGPVGWDHGWIIISNQPLPTESKGQRPR